MGDINDNERAAWSEADHAKRYRERGFLAAVGRHGTATACLRAAARIGRPVPCASRPSPIGRRETPVFRGQPSCDGGKVSPEKQTPPKFGGKGGGSPMQPYYPHPSRILFGLASLLMLPELAAAATVANPL